MNYTSWQRQEQRDEKKKENIYKLQQEQALPHIQSMTGVVQGQ